VAAQVYVPAMRICVEWHHWGSILLSSRLLDVTQRALRDFQKTAAKETLGQLMMRNFGTFVKSERAFHPGHFWT